MKILVVHDERATANSIVEVLHRNGHQALPLYSVTEAIDLAEYLAFDVALITRRLGLSYLELGDYLLKLMPRCKIIFVLDPGIIWFAQGCLKHGLVKEFEYLPESFTTEELVSKLTGIASQCSSQEKVTVLSDSPE